MGVMYKRSFLLLTVLVLFIYQNCAPLAGTGGDSTELSFGGTADFSQVKAILDRNCVTCHVDPTPQNRNVGLTTYQAIMDSGAVLGGNAQSSVLYTSVANGSMPQGLPPLSLQETEAIRTWINAGAPDDEGSVANQVPIINMPNDRTVSLPVNVVEFLANVQDLDGAVLRTVWSQVSGPNTVNFSGDRTPILLVSGVQQGTYTFELLVQDDFGSVVTGRVNLTVNAAPNPPPPPPVATASFANDINPILQNNCLGCHNNVTASGGFNVETYAGVQARVVAGNAGGSLLFQRVENDSMPAGGANPLLQAEKDLIETWIQEGALNN